LYKNAFPSREMLIRNTITLNSFLNLSNALENGKESSVRSASKKENTNNSSKTKEPWSNMAANHN
jgi:hypothetical protein